MQAGSFVYASAAPLNYPGSRVYHYDDIFRHVKGWAEAHCKLKLAPPVMGYIKKTFFAGWNSICYALS
jgi:hypothetical protein